MKPISSMDLYFLIKEFKQLENNRIDNFYFENGIFYLKVYLKRLGNKLLTINLGKYIYLGEKKEEGSFPSSFVQHLRKNLKNSYILSINQIAGERIIDITIEKKQDDEMIQFHLMIEMFSNGNIVFTDSEYVILNSLQKKKYKDRKVMVREVYQLPPQKELLITDLNKELFEQKFKEGDLSIVKFLAMKLGMGGKFAEEICEIADVDKNANELSNFSNLYDTIDLVLNKEIKAYGIYKKEELFDFIPFDFKSIKEEKKDFTSFNDLIREYFAKFLILDDPKEKQFKQEMKKLENRLKKQEKQVEQIEEDYEKYNNMGNKIYENYDLIENLLNSINNAAKEKGWDHVKKTVKENEQLNKIIKTLNYKNNEIVLDLE